MLNYIQTHPEVVLPVCMIVLSFGAGVLYGIKGDYRMCCYWLAACVLNISVTRF